MYTYACVDVCVCVCVCVYGIPVVLKLHKGDVTKEKNGLKAFLRGTIMKKKV